MQWGGVSSELRNDYLGLHLSASCSGAVYKRMMTFEGEDAHVKIHVVRVSNVRGYGLHKVFDKPEICDIHALLQITLSFKLVSLPE